MITEWKLRQSFPGRGFYVVWEQSMVEGKLLYRVRTCRGTDRAELFTTGALSLVSDARQAFDDAVLAAPGLLKIDRDSPRC